MVIYRITADTAFELLTSWSQATNVKLRALALQLSADFLALSDSETLPTRTTYDHLLMTPHLPRASQLDSRRVGPRGVGAPAG